MLKEKYSLEFLSMTEMIELAHKANSGCYAISASSTCVSLVSSSHSIFIMDKSSSTTHLWDDSNCTDHLLLHIYVYCSKKTTYEMCLRHMNLNVADFISHLKDVFSIASSIAKREHLQNELAFGSYIQLPIQGNSSKALHPQLLGVLS